METGRARGISLWLMPGGAARGRLTGLIERLAVRLGTRPFAAHVTLLAGLGGPEEEIVRTAALLAARVRPLRVRLAAVEGRDEHFRCLFALAVPDAPLRAAHAAASHAFGREPDPAFLPHLSLVYGTLSPEVKRSLVAEVAAEAAASFVAGSLHVWRTEGPVADWQAIGAFGLSA